MNANGLPICEAPRAGTRLSWPQALGPPCQISTAASEPCSWSMSHIRLRFRTSPSSQSLALTRCVSSLSGAMEQYSVHTVPQPPSAFMARKWAWKPGRSKPAPLQCATWKKRLGRSSGRPRWARRGCRTSDRGPCASSSVLATAVSSGQASLRDDAGCAHVLCDGQGRRIVAKVHATAILNDPAVHVQHHREEQDADSDPQLLLAAVAAQAALDAPTTMKSAFRRR